MSLFNWINFTAIGDIRGQLVVLEQQRNVPFEVKRVYYLTGLDPKTPRGFHAHKQLWQLAICVQGSCDMVFDDGIERQSINMSSSSGGLLIEPMIWHEMYNFSKDCVFLVLASDYYDESDYIRDFNEFKRLVSK
ncbi:FdtA/QdtA family cupin domain-containing protein [Chromatiaceae bacterium AAb-1]|nr:FdtA/QdtA family cupin domain-containing protein [Chromatiaceae bacterium AAb-1]